MSNRICFQLLYLTSAAVPDWTFSKCPAERKAVAVSSYFTSDRANISKQAKYDLTKT